MKKMFVVFLWLIWCSKAVAAPIQELVFFGDSLSDNGNLYQLLFKTVPKSPPYFNGRFSNGLVWSENLGKHFYDKEYISYKDYAIGGATAVFHFRFKDITCFFTLPDEIYEYSLTTFFQDKSQTLYGIWVGANDYLLNPSGSDEEETTRVVNQMGWAIKRLILQGGRHFFIINMPDLSQLPATKDSDLSARFHHLSVLHNQKLEQALQTIHAAYPEVDITPINIFNIMNDLIANPQKYNEKYQTHIKYTQESCWKGGSSFTNFRQSALTQAQIASTIEPDIRHRILQEQGRLPAHFDIHSASALIAANPMLANTYMIGQQYAAGLKPCADPDEYIFWDGIHPTETTHRLISMLIIEQLAVKAR